MCPAINGAPSPRNRKVDYVGAALATAVPPSTSNPLRWAVAVVSKLITFRDGTVASLAVLEHLWAIEARGGIFILTDNGGYDIEPEGVLTDNERVFLLENQEEARRLVRYVVDDIQ